MPYRIQCEDPLTFLPLAHVSAKFAGDCQLSKLCLGPKARPVIAHGPGEEKGLNTRPSSGTSIWSKPWYVYMMPALVRLYDASPGTSIWPQPWYVFMAPALVRLYGPSPGKFIWPQPWYVYMAPALVCLYGPSPATSIGPSPGTSIWP